MGHYTSLAPILAYPAIQPGAVVRQEVCWVLGIDGFETGWRPATCPVCNLAMKCCRNTHPAPKSARGEGEQLEALSCAAARGIL